MGFNIDGQKPGHIIIGAIGADRWEVDVHGQSAHAGLHPEGGISAALIAARAIQDVAKRGYFGKVKKRRKEGTSNVGTVRGGEASNQVTDHVFVRGESRSHDPALIVEITNAYRTAFENAAASVMNDRGQAGSVDFRSESATEADVGEHDRCSTECRDLLETLPRDETDPLAIRGEERVIRSLGTADPLRFELIQFPHVEGAVDKPSRGVGQSRAVRRQNRRGPVPETEQVGFGGDRRCRHRSQLLRPRPP